MENICENYVYPDICYFVPNVKENNFDEETHIISDTIFSNIAKYSHEEYQYLNLIENILDNGVWEGGRNGKTKSIFGNSMRFSLKDNKIPILTTKKTAWKTCLKELLWFISGKTNNNILKYRSYFPKICMDPCIIYKLCDILKI